VVFKIFLKVCHRKQERAASKKKNCVKYTGEKRNRIKALGAMAFPRLFLKIQAKKMEL